MIQQCVNVLCHSLSYLNLAHEQVVHPDSPINWVSDIIVVDLTGNVTEEVYWTCWKLSTFYYGDWSAAAMSC